MSKVRLTGGLVLLAAAALSACAVRVLVPGPPPAPRIEVRGVAPGPAFLWVEGYWAWHSRWVWAPGRWVVPPRVGAVWVSGRWAHVRGGWRWVPGRWR
jgi:hypothetical protein